MREILPLLLVGVLSAIGIASPRAGAAQATVSETRVRIVDYIETLRRAGLRIVYSNALLTPEMGAAADTGGKNGVAKLGKMLSPYGLVLVQGPRGGWLISAGADARTGTPSQPPNSPDKPSAPPTIDEIVVSASRYQFSESTAPSTHELSAIELQRLPVLGNDALRPLHILPGVTSNGLSASFHVRGGATNENLYILDGLRLHQPYHFKDFQNLFSALNPRVLAATEVRTGGFPAEFGNRLSAVVNMKSREANQPAHYEIAINPFTTALLGNGRFLGDASWLTSVRRSNLDVIADAGDSDIGEPRYSDLFNRLSFPFASGLTLFVETLLLNDELALHDSDKAAASESDRDAYVWLRIVDERSDRFGASYLIARTDLDHDRQGWIREPGLSTGSLTDGRNFTSTRIKADWTLRLSGQRSVRWGAEIDDEAADYRFRSSASFDVPINIGNLARPPDSISLQPAYAGHRQSAYLSYRFRPASLITTELGLRWDRQSLTHDDQPSPRLNLLLDATARLKLRASWGRYYQPADLDDIQIANGTTSIHRPERADQAILGLSYRFGAQGALRIEAYRKSMEQPRPRAENLYYRVSLLPELLPDRIFIDLESSMASGVELTLNNHQGPWAWWFTLAQASVTDTLANGTTMPRSWDEPWSVKAGATWTATHWTVTATAAAHAGWPATRLTLTDAGLVAGSPNGARFDAFETLNVKAERRVALKHGSLTWYVELDNVLDRANPCCSQYSVTLDQENQPAGLNRGNTNWLGRVPSIGIRWERDSR